MYFKKQTVAQRWHNNRVSFTSRMIHDKSVVSFGSMNRILADKRASEKLNTSSTFHLNGSTTRQRV